MVIHIYNVFEIGTLCINITLQFSFLSLKSTDYVLIKKLRHSYCNVGVM